MLSELERQPESDVGGVLPGRRLFKEAARGEPGVVSGQVQVPIERPDELDTRRMADEGRVTPLPRPEQVAGHVIDAVPKASPPEEHPVCLGRQTFRELGFDNGVDLVVVRGAERRDETVVSPFGEQGLVGLEVGILRVPVSAVDVEAKREPRAGGKVAEGVAENRSKGPCSDVSLSEAAPLVDELAVIVPATRIPPEARAVRVSGFFRRALVVGCALVPEAEIVKVQADGPAEGARGIRAPKAAVRVRDIVEEARLRLRGPGRERIHRPCRRPEGRSYTVEAPAHVWSLPIAHQTLPAKCHLLPAGAHDELPLVERYQRDVEEGLADVELVLVDGTRTASTSRFEPALELHEQTYPVVPVEVEVGHVALKQVAVVTGNGAPILVPKPLEEGPRLP